MDEAIRCDGVGAALLERCEVLEHTPLLLSELDSPVLARWYRSPLGLDSTRSPR